MGVFYIYNLTSKLTSSIISVLSTEITYHPTEIQFPKKKKFNGQKKISHLKETGNNFTSTEP